MKLRKFAKKILAPFVPGPLRRLRARVHAGLADKAFEGKSAREVFTKIYADGTWGQVAGQGYFSGTGSHDSAIVEAYVSAVSSLLAAQPAPPDAVDLGCGDFNVGSRIRSLCGAYVACDVVPQLVASNISRFSHLGVDFRCLDIVQDELPKGEVVFIRQVLQHLGNSQISEVVAKVQTGGYRLLVISEHLPLRPEFIPNIDKPMGAGIRMGRGIDESGVVLTQPPFNLRVTSEQVLCELPEATGVIRTVAYTLDPRFPQAKAIT